MELILFFRGRWKMKLHHNLIKSTRILSFSHFIEWRLQKPFNVLSWLLYYMCEMSTARKPTHSLSSRHKNKTQKKVQDGLGRSSVSCFEWTNDVVLVAKDAICFFSVTKKLWWYSKWNTLKLNFYLITPLLVESQRNTAS